MEWLKQHADTLVILSSFALCFWTLNEKVNQIDKDLAVIKTVLIMKNIMPDQLCAKPKEAKQS